MPRLFTTGNHGYHNAALDTTGVAIAFPAAASGCIVNVWAGCFLGFRNSATLITFNDANYGSVQDPGPMTFYRMRDGSQTHIHIAAWATTTAVAIMFI